MKRIISILLSLVMLAAILCGAAPASLAADEKPDGWWPALEAYTKAVESGNEAKILAAGDEYIKVCSTVPLNDFTANQFYNVYLKRMQLAIYENSANYVAARDNTKKLLEVSTYLTEHGTDRRDMILTCRTHLKAIAPSYGVYALSAAQTSPTVSRTSGFSAFSGRVSAADP